MNIAFGEDSLLYLTFHKTCKGLRTGQGNGQSQLVHRHAISHCKTIDATEGNFSGQQLPQQHAKALLLERKEERKTKTLVLNECVATHRHYLNVHVIKCEGLRTVLKNVCMIIGMSSRTFAEM